MKIVTALYSHPEFYPPTINALNSLANEIEEVYCVHRDVYPSSLKYPQNIHFVKSGKKTTIRETEKASFIWKAFSFFTFAGILLKTLRKSKANYVLVYDPIPFLAFILIKPFLPQKVKLWYHNHDIIEPQYVKKYSISWFALKNERKNLIQTAIFSLPANERKSYFNFKGIKDNYFFLPNYPSLHRFIKKTPTPLNNCLKIIYQGHIGKGHGLEKIISFVALSKQNLSLSIIGIAKDKEYVDYLNSHIQNLDANHKITIYDPLPSYDDLLAFSSNHHVGLAIYEPVNTQFRTVTTASNKIYEYVALGMPTLLLDHKNYRNLLDAYSWAKFTDLSTKSFELIFEDVFNKYDEYASAALNSFQTELNFENHFYKAWSYFKSNA